MSNLEYLDELSKEFNISKNELVKYIAIVGTNKENIRDYALNVNCAVCRKQNGFIVDYVACMINDKDRKITELKDKLALTEKAFKLLCQNTGCMGCPLDSEDCDSWRGVEQSCSKAIHDYFMSKAKEMLKSE